MANGDNQLVLVPLLSPGLLPATCGNRGSNMEPGSPLEASLEQLARFP